MRGKERVLWVFGALVAMALAAAVADAKVVLFVGFDEGSGAAAKASDGAAGKVIGNAKWTAGKFGKAFDFDGSTAVQFEKKGALAGLKEPITVGAWVKPAALTGWTNIAEMDAPQGKRAQKAWKLGFNNTAPVWTTYEVKDHTGKGPVALNEWSHVVATYDGKMAKLYVNGKLDAEVAASGKVDTAAADVTSFDIGWRSSTKSSFFTGAIDEVFIADAAMSDADIATAMKGLAPPGTAVDPQGRLATRWATLKDVR
jgi:hypothetical protein